MQRPFCSLSALALAIIAGGGWSPLPAQSNNCGTGQFGWSQPSAQGSGSFHSAAQEQHHKIFERNQAWPQPFNCWDRTAYLGLWSQMYTSGLATDCTLSDSHFEPGTNRLNRMGERKLLTVMQNNPEWQRGVLVAPSRDQQLSAQRLESVRDSVRQWYGEQLASQVAFSLQVPEPASGLRIQAINAGYLEAMQAPTINQGGGSGGAGGGAGGGADSGAGGGAGGGSQ